MDGEANGEESAIIAGLRKGCAMLLRDLETFPGTSPCQAVFFALENVVGVKCLAAALGLLCAMAAADSHAQVYKWVDASGRVDSGDRNDREVAQRDVGSFCS